MITSSDLADRGQRGCFGRSALPRGLALFLGGFALLNLLGDWRRAGFDANLWWLDLRALPPAIEETLLLLAAVRNTEALFNQLHARRVLVVSHFYHLPRVKLAYQRAGREVYTVPAKESYLLRHHLAGRARLRQLIILQADQRLRRRLHRPPAALVRCGCIRAQCRTLCYRQQKDRYRSCNHVREHWFLSHSLRGDSVEGKTSCQPAVLPVDHPGLS